jgi:hypothetical protein
MISAVKKAALFMLAGVLVAVAVLSLQRSEQR